MARHGMANRFTLSDALWEKIQPLLPVRVNTHRFGGGRPPADDRRCLEAIFFRLRTGCQWKALDATGLCPGSTAHDRFQQWVAAGVFQRFWQAGLVAYDELKGLDWAWLSMDGAMSKAPLGGGKTGRNPTDRGKRGVKRSLLAEAAGVPVAVAIEGANRHDMKLARATLEALAANKPWPRADAPQGLCLDKGYDFDEARELLAEFGFTAPIRSRGEEARDLTQAPGAKARRWVVERDHRWLNRFRGVLIRWCKKPENYLAMLHFACGLIAYQQSGLFG